MNVLLCDFMDIAQLKLKLKELEEAKKEAKKKKNKICSAANSEYYQTVKKGDEFIKTLTSELEDLAWEKVKDEAPYGRDGSRIMFDYLYLEDKGVSIRWDADHPNDIVDADLTFEDLYT